MELVFDQVVKNYRDFLHSVVFRIIKDNEETKDIVQDVFISYYKNIDKFRNDSNLSTYLYRIAVNKSIDFIRKQKREKTELEENFSNHSNNKDEINSLEIKIVVERALNKLPLPYRVPIILLEYENKNYEEISKLLNLPLNTVKTRVARAREKLLKILSNMGVTITI